MTPIEIALRALAPLIREGDAHGLPAAERAIYDFVASYAKDTPSQADALRKLEIAIKSVPGASSRDSFDFVSFLLTYIGKHARGHTDTRAMAGDDLLARAEATVRRRTARDPRS